MTSEPRRLIAPLARLTTLLAEPAYALVRIVAGGFLVPHGMWKLFGITGGTQAQMVEFFRGIGLEPAVALVYAVGLVEFFGGILIAIGLFTRPAALAAAVTTGVAAFYFHLPLGFYVENGGAEFALLWTAVLLMIAMRGGGAISLDRRIGVEF